MTLAPWWFGTSSGPRPLGTAGPFRQSPPQAGWLGDPATGQIAPAWTFAGEPSAASWFPTRPLAEQWAAFIGW